MRILLAFTLSLPLLAQTTPHRLPLPVPNLPGYQTLKCDFHMHTVFSDGEVWPETRIQEAWRDGLDCLAITDHDDYHPHKATISTDLKHPHAIAKPEADRLGLLLVPAVEITKGDIHVNALFIQDFNSTANLELLPALEVAKKQGAFLFWNHPGWRGNRSWYPQIDAAHKAGLIHGVEVINAGQLEPQTLPWIEEKKLTILSNTDIHQLVEYPTGQHRDSITLVIAKTRDLAGIREALDAKRTLAWRNDELWGDGTLLREFVTASVNPRRAGDSLLVTNRSAVPFHVSIQANGRTNRATIHPQAESEVQMPGKGPYDVEFTNIHLTNGKNLSVTMDH